MIVFDFETIRDFLKWFFSRQSDLPRVTEPIRGPLLRENDFVDLTIQAPHPHRYYPVSTFEEVVELTASYEQANFSEEPFYHHSGGMAMRNSFGLWDQNSPLHQDMLRRFGICHADDMSGMISKAADAILTNHPYDAEADAAYYRNFWLNQGIDPATMEIVGPLSNESITIRLPNGPVQIYRNEIEDGPN